MKMNEMRKKSKWDEREKREKNQQKRIRGKKKEDKLK